MSQCQQNPCILAANAGYPFSHFTTFKEDVAHCLHGLSVTAEAHNFGPIQLWKFGFFLL